MRVHINMTILDSRVFVGIEIFIFSNTNDILTTFVAIGGGRLRILK